MTNAWRNAIEKRIGHRDRLSKENLYRLFWNDLAGPGVIEALGAIEFECNVEIGLMRPTDALTILFVPPATNDPFKSMVYQVHSGDTDFELSRPLNARVKKSGRTRESR